MHQMCWVLLDCDVIKHKKENYAFECMHVSPGVAHQDGFLSTLCNAMHASPENPQFQCSALVSAVFF